MDKKRLKELVIEKLNKLINKLIKKWKLLLVP